MSEQTKEDRQGQASRIGHVTSPPVSEAERQVNEDEVVEVKKSDLRKILKVLEKAERIISP